MLHPAWMTSAKFIFGPSFGENALKMKDLRLSLMPPVTPRLNKISLLFFLNKFI